MYMFFARYLQKERIFKLAASVVGHPNNGEMVPPRPAKAVYSSPKTVGSIVEKFYTLTFGMEITKCHLHKSIPVTLPSLSHQIPVHAPVQGSVLLSHQPISLVNPSLRAKRASF